MTNHVIKNNLLRLTQDIVPYTPKIVAVTKYYDVSAILDAYDVGLRIFGESRANDAIKKIDQAASKNLIHKNCAARKKSNLANKVNKA